MFFLVAWGKSSAPCDSLRVNLSASSLCPTPEIEPRFVVLLRRTAGEPSDEVDEARRSVDDMLVIGGG